MPISLNRKVRKFNVRGFLFMTGMWQTSDITGNSHLVGFEKVIMPPIEIHKYTSSVL